MKFISKSTNLLVVLRAGLSAQPITGTPAKPTVSVRFKDGVAEVPEGELCDMMLAHPGYNSDYIAADIVSEKTYAGERQEVEPVHVLTELKYGTPVARKMAAQKVVLTPELNQLIQEIASEMSKKMLPGMVEATLKSLVETHETQKKGEAAVIEKKKPGRPAKKVDVSGEKSTISGAFTENPRIKDEV